VGRTPPDTTPVTSVAFSESGASLCAASSDSLRVWGWDPAIEAKVSLPIGWDKVYEMRIAPNTNQLLAGAFNSNFVSIYSVDLDEFLVNTTEDDDEEEEEDSVVDESHPVHLDSTPEKLHDSLAKEVPDEPDSPEDKWGSDYENDFEDDFKLDMAALDGKGGGGGGGGEKDSKGSSGPGVEWDAGVTPRDLATSMGESFLAKLKEDERKARRHDGNGQSSPRARPPSTAQRHRNPPRRPTTTHDSPAPKAEQKRPGTHGLIKKPASHYNGMDGAGNGQGGLGLEGLEIVGSKHASRDSASGSASRGGGGNIGSGGYRYAFESAEDMTSSQDAHVVVRSKEDVRSVSRGGDRASADRERAERERSDRERADRERADRERADRERADRDREEREEREAERRRVSPRRTPEEKQQSREQQPPQQSYLQPTQSSSAAKDKDTEEMLDRLVSQSSEVVSTLSQRLTNLKLLNQYWKGGDISTIIDHLKTIQLTSQHDPHGCVVLADFFSSVDLKASPSMSLDVCGKILPVLDGMLGAGAGEEVSMAALVGVISLAESYGPIIADTRGVVARHVDISREERIVKCNVSHRTFAIILEKCDSLKQKHRKNDLFRSVLDRAQSLLLNIV
jgi:hypothetical protein